MDIHGIEDAHELFMRLVAMNSVTTGRLQHFQRGRTRWRVKCYVYEPGEKHAAKEGMTEFLETVWSATDCMFTFNPYGRDFWIYFNSPKL